MTLRLCHKNGFLFSAPIKDNILFSNPSLPQTTADDAAHQACVYDDIIAFPNQWLTMVGEKGIMLSGGQQHRLAMARGYASTHHMLILDDVLSSVDHDTEANMIEAMYNHDNTPTTIIIAHRVSALSKCDHIIVLDEGKIIQEGSHDDLIQQSGIYQATWQYQQLEAALNDSHD